MFPIHTQRHSLSTPPASAPALPPPPRPPSSVSADGALTLGMVTPQDVQAARAKASEQLQLAKAADGRRSRGGWFQKCQKLARALVVGDDRRLDRALTAQYLQLLEKDGAEAEHEDFIGLFWRWLLLLTAVAGFSAAVFLGFLPSEAILPVLFLSFAALLGGLLGIVIGLFRSR